MSRTSTPGTSKTKSRGVGQNAAQRQGLIVRKSHLAFDREHRQERDGVEFSHAIGNEPTTGFHTACGRRPDSFRLNKHRKGWGLSAWDSLLLIPDYMPSEVKRAAGRDGLFNIKQTKRRFRVANGGRLRGGAREFSIDGEERE
jgi:hypothetical protein